LKMSFPIIFAAGFIIIGILLLLKAVIPSFQLSTFRFVFGILIIIFGINMLFSSFGSTTNTTVNSSSGSKQSIVFGERIINVDKDMVGNLDLDCAFGSLTVNIPRNKNVRISSSCAFGTINMPNGNSVSFGSLNEDFSSSGEVLNIKLNCAFGTIHVRYID